MWLEAGVWAAWPGAQRSTGWAGGALISCTPSAAPSWRREPAGWLLGPLTETAVHFLLCTKHLSVQYCKQGVIVPQTWADPAHLQTRHCAGLTPGWWHPGPRCLQEMSKRHSDWKVRLRVRVVDWACFSLQPIQIINSTIEMVKPGKFPSGKTEIPFEFPLHVKGNKVLYETYHGVFVNIQVSFRAPRSGSS